MLVGLIKSNSKNRVYEPNVEYSVSEIIKEKED